jgi:sterol carrier protein 2
LTEYFIYLTYWNSMFSYFLGLAQCAELCWQLRGMAGRRQVPNAKLALQHNIGLGGAVVVALYKLGFPEASEGRYA